MIPYILHVTVIIAVCFLFYKLLLQRETFFRLNRWTLLLCLGVSFTLPLLPVPQNWSWQGAYRQVFSGSQPASGTREAQPETGNATAMMAKTPEETAAIPPSSGNAVNSPGSLIKPADPAQTTVTVRPAGTGTNKVTGQDLQLKDSSGGSTFLSQVFHWLYYLYIFGVIVFGINLIFQLIILFFESYNRPVVQDGPFRIVEMTGDQAPCSFGNIIFINPARYDWDTYNQILLHEKIHIRQRHTIDILFAEVVLVLQWFNPVAWLYRKEVEKNLEFLTDQLLLSDQEVERSAYQMNLLKVSAPHLPLGITTNYNQSLLKRRIVMMNAKRSSIHTIWKYFFLLPLLTCLVCALNKPVAIGQSPAKEKPVVKAGETSEDRPLHFSEIKGSWFATTSEEKLCLDLKKDGSEGHWANNMCVPKKEFTNLPTTGKCEFKLDREAGTITFTGQWDGDQGYGHYIFKPDEAYFRELQQKGVAGLDDNDEFAFFQINIKKDYVDMLHHNGFPNVSKHNLIAMAAMKIDKDYLQYWKDLGYTDLSEQNIIAAKAMKIDKPFIEDIRSAGYDHLSINKLIALKSQGITGGYIRELKNAKMGSGSMAHGASAASDSSRGVGSESVSVTVPVPPAPAPNVRADANVSVNPGVRVNPKIENVSIVDVDEVDENNVSISVDDIIAFKSLKIDSEYLTSLKNAGYGHIPMRDVITMRSLHITPAFIKSFEAVGYKDIPIDALISLKSTDITPAYIKTFQALGYHDISLNELPALKSMNITPEYIKSLKDAGYEDIPLNQLTALKSLNITPEYINEFKKIGFKHISLNQLPALKSMGVTPAYVTKMREKGFVSEDLNKYIQLKSAFN